MSNPEPLQRSPAPAPLRIGEADGAAFDLPPQLATEALAIFGRRGTGKTYTASVLVEEVLAAGQQVVVIDPTDVWWGLKGSADGNHEGFPVAILGGPHADLPLEATDAVALADFAVEEHASLVLSLRHLRKGARDHFVATFSEQLYQRKGEAKHRTPLLMVFDEARLAAPQKVGKDQARLVAAVEDIVRLGRASGLGAMLVDARPASVNKNVISQLEVLVCHRILSPHDRRAIDEWVVQHDAEGRRKEFLETLPSLAKGKAWFWSPALNVFELVAVRRRKTYDSSRTPELGETPASPGRTAWADADIEALRGLLVTAKQDRAGADDDPESLRRRVRELESALAHTPGGADRASGGPGAPRAARLERKILELEAAKEEAIRLATTPLHDRIEFLESALAQARDHFAAGVAILDRGVAGDAPGVEPPPENRPPTREAADTPAAEELSPSSAPLEEEPKAPHDPAHRPDRATINAYRTERLAAVARNLSDLGAAILSNLGVWDEAGTPALERENLAVLVGRSPKYSRFGTRHLDPLSEEGPIEYLPSETTASEAATAIRITANGRAVAALPPVEPDFPATLPGLHAAWLSRLPEPLQPLFSALVGRYPQAFSREGLAREIVSSARSGAFSRKLADLRSWGLLEQTESGELRTSDLPFPPGEPQKENGAPEQRPPPRRENIA